jgi:hypothetical protein
MKPAPTPKLFPAQISLPTGYGPWLTELKADIRAAQLRASIALTKVVDRLAQDLRTEFPDMRGFSPRNLKYMRAFAEAWPDASIVQQAAAQLPWFHLCTPLDKLATRQARDWYTAPTIGNRVATTDELALAGAARGMVSECDTGQPAFPSSSLSFATADIALGQPT